MMVPWVDPEVLRAERTRKSKDWATKCRDADEGDETERRWPRRMRLPNANNLMDPIQSATAEMMHLKQGRENW